MLEADFVVVGGGIAGVSCAETLILLQPEKAVILITESPLVKSVINLRMVTKTLCSFDVTEQDIQALSDAHPQLNIIEDTLTEICSQKHQIITKNNRIIKYQYLCLCVGGKPKIIPSGENSPYVLGIRDTDSVKVLVDKIGTAKKLALIGNGGIATELIHKIENIQVDWIIKDKHITATFVDPGAAEFFQTSLNETDSTQTQVYRTHLKYQQNKECGSGNSGAALGPDWYNNYHISGSNTTKKQIKLHYETEVAQIEYIQGEHPVKIQLTNGETISCDLIVSATGVLPRTDFKMDGELIIAADNGIQVDEFMNTSLLDVFAAGDVCTPNWTYAKHWFPMRLWTQARQMGCYAAKCMSAKLNREEVMQDFCFELFAHSTNLFGYKVVLLGLYNGQTLGTDYECLIRMTPRMEFIKFVLKDHRLHGAILIGDTDLAETCENLILNQLDLSPYGDDILNPDIDIEDYFD